MGEKVLQNGVNDYNTLKVSTQISRVSLKLSTTDSNQSILILLLSSLFGMANSRQEGYALTRIGFLREIYIVGLLAA